MHPSEHVEQLAHQLPQSLRSWIGPRHPPAGLPPAMDIPELVELILSKLSRPSDLARMAQTAKRYADIALKLLWEHPDFQGDPLRNMASLFPDGIKRQLLNDTPDLTFRVDSSLFRRFDYYANFIRHLQVWQFRPDKYIATVLNASRPGIPLFPNLDSIHLGADSNSLEMAGPYLSSTLRTVRINHWDPETSTVVWSTTGIAATLIQVFSLPQLQCLDLLDTRFPRYEEDQHAMSSLLRLMPQLVEFYSYDLTTLIPVFDILARSVNLKAMFLDLTTTRHGHYAFPEIAQLLRVEFLPLRSLVLHCDSTRARDFVAQVARELQCCDFRIDGPLDVTELGQLATSLQASMLTLRVLRCSTSLRAPPGGEHDLYQAFAPLLQMARLQKVVMTITVMGSSMFRDDQVEEIFKAWPSLCVFSLESDPEDATPINNEDPTGYGLTLKSLLTIRRCCPDLYELSLPWIDTFEIPSLVDIAFKQSSLPFEIHLSRCHAHNRQDVRQFIQKIWAKAKSSFEDCLCSDLEDEP